MPMARLALLPLLLAVACAPPADQAAAPAPTATGEVRTVDGWVTQLDGDRVSVRAVDGRQFVFTMEKPLVPLDYLERRMLDRRALKFTYTAERGWLIPLSIEEACPPEDPCMPRPSPS